MVGFKRNDGLIKQICANYTQAATVWYRLRLFLTEVRPLTGNPSDAGLPTEAANRRSQALRKVEYYRSAIKGAPRLPRSWIRDMKESEQGSLESELASSSKELSEAQGAYRQALSSAGNFEELDRLVARADAFDPHVSRSRAAPSTGWG